MFDQMIPVNLCGTEGPADPTGPDGCSQLISYKEPTMLEQLQNKRVFAATKLAEIDAAIEALTANPDLEKALTAISRSMRY